MMAPTQSTNSNNGSRATNNANSLDSPNANTKSPIQKYLTNCKSLYSCIYCRTHLANHDELVSRSFQGNHGRAYLFNSVVNVSCGPAVQRELNTGSHAVADIHCSNCRTTLGWKYEKAYVESQKYKEGKYIIELAHVVRENRHLEFDKGEMFLERSRKIGCAGYQSRRSYGSSTQNNNQNRRSLQCGTTGNHRASLTPPSASGLWSSSGNANGGSSNEEVASPDRNHHDYDCDDDDEELMFPFYDDMCCGNRSSFPSSLSSSLHNRMRRSLYLDSTPYDWKYATSASSADNSNEDASTSFSSGYTSPAEFSNQSEEPKLKSSATSTTNSNSIATKGSMASSFDDSGLSDLSTSSVSSNVSPEQDQMSYHNKNSNLDSRNKYKASGSSSSNGSSSSCCCSATADKDNSEHHEQETYKETSNDDMQFKFEADRPELPMNNIINSDRSTQKQVNNKHCDQFSSDTKFLSSQIEQQHPPVEETESNGDNSNSTSLGENGRERSRDLSPSSSNQQDSFDEADSLRGNSISLEDDEFYDCYTDHEVSIMLAESDSTSTLKIVD